MGFVGKLILSATDRRFAPTVDNNSAAPHSRAISGHFIAVVLHNLLARWDNGATDSTIRFSYGENLPRDQIRILLVPSRSRDRLRLVCIALLVPGTVQECNGS